MQSPLRFGVIGTNFISDLFCEAAREVEGVEVASVFSRTEERGRAFAKKQGTSAYCSEYREMLDSDVDAIYVASPNFMHEQQSIAAMEAGKHVLCEKVMAPSSEAVDRMIAASERCGVVLLEAMRPDFDPVTEKIRKIIPSLGKIRRVHFEYCQYSSRYDKFKAGEVLNAFNPKIGNSALADIGVYPLHLAINLFGVPKDMYARSLLLDGGFEGIGELSLSYEDMLLTVSYSKITDGVRPSVIEGELGSLTIDHMTSPRSLVLFLRGEEPCTVCCEAVKNNMIYEISAFRDAVNGILDPRGYLEVTRQTVRLIDNALKMSGAVAYFDPTVIPHS